MQRLLYFTGIILFCFHATKGQETKSGQQAIEDLVEEIAQSIEADVDFSQITSDLYYFLDNPINLNNTNEETLDKLRFLNDFQIISLLNYIQTKGNLATLYELQLIEGFDYATIKKLLPFVTLSKNNETKSWMPGKALKYGKHTVMERVSAVVETQQGFKNVSDSILNTNLNKYYPGNELRIYTRYKFNYKRKLQWGITAEKDPGEQFLDGAQNKGFDFYSAHLQISDVGIIKTIVLGDFQAQFGQGLIMWSYLTQGKSSYVMDIRKRGKGLNKYSSTDENAFFRGGGITLERSGLQFSAFGSYKNIDANISKDTLSDEQFFTTILNSGIHATPSEIEDKDAINETVYGGNLNWRYKNVKMGVSGIKYQFNNSFVLDDSPQNRFRFSGKSNSNLSADVEFKFKAIHLFSEAAYSENGGKAILAGALLNLTSQVRASVLYRNYEKEFQALYSNAFAEGSHTQNEQGFYMGIDLIPIKKWKIAGYYDFYKFPWVTSRAYSPSKGDDFLVQADYTVTRILSMYWRYKKEIKEENSDNSDNGIPKLSNVEKSSFRYQIGYVPGENWELRNRIELSSFSKEDAEKEWGYMLYQDIIYRPKTSNLSVVFRYAVFDTESYNTRIYTYETDVLYAYSVPPLYDKGTRTYIMLHYSPSNNIDFWLRFAQTWYANKTEIGSGLNQIDGDTKSDVKFQLRWKF